MAGKDKFRLFCTPAITPRVQRGQPSLVALLLTDCNQCTATVSKYHSQARGSSAETKMSFVSPNVSPVFCSACACRCPFQYLTSVLLRVLLIVLLSVPLSAPLNVPVSLGPGRGRRLESRHVFAVMISHQMADISRCG